MPCPEIKVNPRHPVIAVVMPSIAFAPCFSQDSLREGEPLVDKPTNRERSHSEAPPMRYIILFFAFTLCFSGCAEVPNQTKLKPGVTFELHAVAPQADGTTKPLADPDSGAILDLIDPPIITAANVNAATVTTDDNDVVMLSVDVDAPGTAKLLAATSVPGNRVAVVVNGKIATAPVIQEQIGSKFTITSADSKHDWKGIVQ